MSKHTSPYVNFATIRAARASGMPWQRRYVLHELWSLADGQTGVIRSPYSFSGLHTLMDMSERAIKGHVRQLEADGWLEVTRPAVADAIRKHAKNRYRCIPRTEEACAADAQAQETPETKAQVARCASAALVQQMHTSQETITSTTPKSVALKERMSPPVPSSQEKNPRLCVLCANRPTESQTHMWSFQLSDFVTLNTCSTCNSWLLDTPRDKMTERQQLKLDSVIDDVISA